MFTVAIVVGVIASVAHLLTMPSSSIIFPKPASAIHSLGGLGGRHHPCAPYRSIIFLSFRHLMMVTLDYHRRCSTSGQSFGVNQTIYSALIISKATVLIIMNGIFISPLALP